MESTKFSFRGVDWRSVGRGALVAIGGALLTYVSTFITGHDFGAYTALVVAGWSVVVNVARKYIEE